MAKFNKVTDECQKFQIEKINLEEKINSHDAKQKVVVERLENDLKTVRHFNFEQAEIFNAKYSDLKMTHESMLKDFTDLGRH